MNWAARIGQKKNLQAVDRGKLYDFLEQNLLFSIADVITVNVYGRTEDQAFLQNAAAESIQLPGGTVAAHPVYVSNFFFMHVSSSSLTPPPLQTTGPDSLLGRISLQTKLPLQAGSLAHHGPNTRFPAKLYTNDIKISSAFSELLNMWSSLFVMLFQLLQVIYRPTTAQTAVR